MTFPLESGTCRVVCRPNRKEPRKATLNAAIRMAIAAMKDQNLKPCDVAAAVALGVGCSNVTPGAIGKVFGYKLDVLESEVNDTRSALINLLEAITGMPMGGPNSGTVLKWLIRNATKIYDIFSAVKGLVDAAGELSDASLQVIHSGRRLIEQTNKGNK